MAEVKIRKEFPETWLWEVQEDMGCDFKFYLNYCGSGNFLKQQSDSSLAPLCFLFLFIILIPVPMISSPSVGYAVLEDSVVEAVQLSSVVALGQHGPPGNENVRIRSKFPETWIWEVFTSESGLVSLQGIIVASTVRVIA